MSDEMDQITALRLKLLENGFSPIRNRDKRTFCEGWPSLEITPDEIARWSRMTRDKATGIRVEHGLAVIDTDIHDQKVVDDNANATCSAAQPIHLNKPISKTFDTIFTPTAIKPIRTGVCVSCRA